jgi:hypothetical protein
VLEEAWRKNQVFDHVQEEQRCLANGGANQSGARGSVTETRIRLQLRREQGIVWVRSTRIDG